ncbi:chemotaxis protein CheB [Geodermatophilus dictyosporus]|uniref:chemotaxis protein CheB n=1 Tax=Geodermatophilus dictyosporus TaxID=1523247 RepID=UPI00145C285E|nr:chemotaxis protein CheB [Geodermatophilus dictyosporus]
MTLVTSAGGLGALSVVLRDLPEDFAAAVVVAQHLGGQGSALLDILQRRVALPLEWARDGAPIRAGRVTVCPPRSVLEVLPDGSCAVRPISGVLEDRPLDTLLASVGDSYGASALGVVLTGMGRDGAAGAAALRAAGGTVIAQDEETAEQPSMPRAAAEAGAHLVLPLHEIGRVVADVVAGGGLPRPRTEVEAVEALFGGPGHARAELRGIEWSTTPLGPVASWSASLRALVRAVLDTEFPMFLMWGPELVQIGNDAYAPTLGTKRMQGLPVRTTWPELWDVVGPRFERIRRTGEPVFARDAEFSPNRRGFVEEAYFTYCYSALHDDGHLAGVLETSLETTARVLADRRLATLRALATSGVGAESLPSTCDRAIRTLEQNPRDVPFALVYLSEPTRGTAHLCASTGVEPGSGVAPRTLSTRAGDAAWPVGRVLADGTPLLVDDLGTRFAAFHAGPWPEGPRAAVLLPIRPVTDEPPIGVLVAGFSPRLVVDEAYRGFLDLVGTQISATVAEARTRRRERERLERLAELDRVKTEFFSNVSHEFRTPLTLMLGPLEDLLQDGDELPPRRKAELELVRRNARRLLRLVGTMLDFSQIEAGRLRARFAPVDLAERTREIVAQFDSAVSRAGLDLHVEVEELPEPVWVDVEMWEKVVSNLVSNALKFTFDGRIEVALRRLPKHAELVVRDTGVGIPAEELPHVFKRFHRVRGTRARTYEGAGIGLALVDELVRRHHGRIRATSTVGEGTTFTVWIPLGRRPVPPEALRDEPPRTTEVAGGMAEEAMQWGEAPGPQLLADDDDDAVRQSLRGYGAGARVLVADDHGDMRQYLARLLAPQWTVDAASDGAEALERARRDPPDLVLADVMMPGLDGFGLLRELRQDETLRTVPVVLVTARAGEEAAIDGLLAGADDYIVKPFSARELVARVGGQLELARTRRRNEELNGFLVRFSDAVRGLTDPAEVARTACRMVRDQLGADRAYWAEVDWAQREWVVAGESHAQGIPPVGGRFPLDAWQPQTSWLLDGRPNVVDDTRRDPRLPTPVQEALTELGVGADLGVPVLADGRTRCALTLNGRRPRRWSAEEIALVEGVAVRCWGEVERARAEAALRESEKRQAFLLALSDALCPLADPGEIQDTAARVLGEHLGATRVMYAEVDGGPGAEVGTLRGRYQAPEGAIPGGSAPPPFPDRYSYSSYGEQTMARRRLGQTMAVTDVTTDPRFDPSEREAWVAGGVRAAVTVALVKAGRFVAEFGVQSATPRAWTADEVDLVETTAERTWAAAERARAEAALRGSEAKYRTLFESIDEGFCVIELLDDADGTAVDFRFVEVNEAFQRQTGLFGITGRLGSDVDPGREPYWVQTYGRVARTGEAERFESHHRNTGRWYDVYATRVDDAGSRRVAVVFKDVTDRREREERQAFLLQLSDSLRAQPDERSIETTTVTMLAGHLRLDRCWISQVSGQQGFSTVGPEHHRPDVPPMSGVFRLSDYPETMRQLATQPMAVEDAAVDARFPDPEKALLAGFRLRALLVAPLRRGPREVVWALAAAMATPRRWTEGERALLEEVAERAWTAIERTRAERALRESEERWRRLYEAR